MQQHGCNIIEGYTIKNVLPSVLIGVNYLATGCNTSNAVMLHDLKQGA